MGRSVGGQETKEDGYTPTNEGGDRSGEVPTSLDSCSSLAAGERDRSSTTEAVHERGE